ncbi:uncharacterized protein LOC143430873 [Xylocopa sonorina]|uniref:uncharacterized protein LOC143430873 n=1 Tax=Xylocopa sonorina TaxID=1818115 RepID=UPI00403B1227
MGEPSDKEAEQVRKESNKLEPAGEIESASDKCKVVADVSEQETSGQAEVTKNCGKTIECSQSIDETSNARTKVKRKLRSTRRRLNAMISNTSLHFSDTDSEGELTTINSPARSLSYAENEQEKPIICVTSSEAEAAGSTYLSPDDKGPSQRNFTENLTDVDEIYPSESEGEQKESQNGLKAPEDACQGETDLEDFEAEDEAQSMIYVTPRSDIFCEYSAETITTKEGDGPFSVEVRNEMCREDVSQSKLSNGTPEIVVMCDTDEEDVVVSDEDDAQQPCCSHKELPEDLDVLVASQVVMKNINKIENMLIVKDTSDDAISDCHTDVEEVDPNE